MLTRRELISWAISPDMPSYDSLLFRAVNGVDGAYRSPTANQKEKRKKREKRAMTNATRISSWCVVVGRGSLSLSLSVGNTSRSTTCDKMTKYVENGSGRRARASLLPYQQQLRKFMNQNVFLVRGGGPLYKQLFFFLYISRAMCIFIRRRCNPNLRSYFGCLVRYFISREVTLPCWVYNIHPPNQPM